MFVTTIHGHDRITLCAHTHVQAHRVILSQLCIVVSKKSRNLVAKFGTKKVWVSHLVSQSLSQSLTRWEQEMLVRLKNILSNLYFGKC